MVAVVTHESNMASYFPEAENLNGRNADMCSMWLSRQVAALGICLSFQIGQIQRTFTNSPNTSSTAGLHLGFQRDYNYHAAFRACYVIMRKVYYKID